MVKDITCAFFSGKQELSVDNRLVNIQVYSLEGVGGFSIKHGGDQTLSGGVPPSIPSLLEQTANVNPEEYALSITQ